MKVRIFTDGSCSENPGPGGWATVFNCDTDCKTYAGFVVDTTNNRMELTAMIEALKQILEQELVLSKESWKYWEHWNPNGYEIFSDSAYVVNAINLHWIEKWKKLDWKKARDNEDIKNKDLWQELDKVYSKIQSIGISVKIEKVKGHAGNTFNELVDKLAKEQSAKAILIKKAGRE